MRRLAVISAVHTAQLLQHANNSQQTYNMSVGVGPNTGRSGRYETDLHGNVNILLGGAMLGGVILVVFLVCYCCHRSMRKHRPHEYSQYWRPEPDVHSLEVFTMDSHTMQCYERNAMSLNNLDELPTSATATTLTSLPARRPSTPGPPPAYESLIFKSYLTSPSDKKPDFSSCILPVPIDLERGINNHHHQHHQHHHHQQHRRSVGKDDENHSSRHVIDHDEGLPSYEAALKLEAHGYV